MSAYFIASTGTGGGKTFTTCALIHAARARGKSARGLKPVISGFDAADASGDVAQIAAAMVDMGKNVAISAVSLSLRERLGEGFVRAEGSISSKENSSLTVTSAQAQPSPRPSPSGEGAPAAPFGIYPEQVIDAIAPYRFTAPLSPHRAAAQEGKEIDVAELVRWTKHQLAIGADVGALTLIEGVGGVMVPLTEQYTTLDWMAALDVPVVLVVGSYLGTISHTLTALEVLRARGLNVQALIMNETAGASITLDEAWAGLAPFIADIPWRVRQPLVSSWQQATAIHALEL